MMMELEISSAKKELFVTTKNYLLSPLGGSAHDSLLKESFVVEQKIYL